METNGRNDHNHSHWRVNSQLLMETNGRNERNDHHFLQFLSRITSDTASYH